MIKNVWNRKPCSNKPETIQQLTIFRLIIDILVLFIIYDLCFVQNIDKKDLYIPRVAN